MSHLKVNAGIHNKGVSLYREKEEIILSSKLPFNITETEQVCVKSMSFYS